MSVTAFRVLVIAEFLLIIIGLVVDYATQSQLPQALQDYLAAENEAEVEMNLSEWVLIIGGITVISLYFISMVGLLCLWRPARWLYTLGLLLALPLYLLTGPTVTSSAAYLVDEFSSIVTGLILAVMYFSPLKVHFDPPSEPLPA